MERLNSTWQSINILFAAAASLYLAMLACYPFAAEIMGGAFQYVEGDFQSKRIIQSHDFHASR
jgi:hypothetical protein